MEYTVKELADLAGVSARTLRYYDQIGLLKPARVTESGYRIYGPHEVDLLQQILFYRELDVGLDQIKAIVSTPDFDQVAALREHYRRFKQKRARLDRLIETVAKAIASREGEITVSDAEKFAAFKEKLIAENEAKYGEEIRAKYGEETVEASNAKFRGMSEEDYNAMVKLEQEVRSLLSEAMEQGDPASPLARKLAEKHKEWLMFSWPSYSPDAHAGLAETYVADERFAAYYNQCGEGAAEFLRDAILNYLGKK